ncbi:MAG: multidrug effflux MFS transporter [Alphaproteobacteria bacterium]
MTKPTPKREDILANASLPMPLWELVTLVAALMALNAFAIDIMLPALDDISATYELTRPNDQQLVVFSYILGFGVPQLVFGPISDSYGRRSLLRLCLIGYAVASFACMMTTTFELLLLTRFLQGVVSSGIRVVAVSIVRDLVAGRAMARIMSLVMTIFMIVPIIAPAVGQGVIHLSSWQWSFGVLGIAGLMVLVWVNFRLPETLPEASRHPFKLRTVGQAFINVLKERETFGYMAASGVIFGALFAFIASSEQIFSDVFNQGARFALWFAVIAGTLAVGNLTNARLVERFGMRRISHGVMIAFITLALTNVLAMYFFGERLEIFVPLFALTFGCFGMLGANFSAIAMEPQGSNAGTASSIYGFATSTVASVFGWAVAHSFNGHVIPILLGFVALGVLSLIIVLFTEKGKLFEVGH